MSTTILLACGAPPLADLVDALALDDLRIDADPAVGLVPGTYYLHREGVSTRSTEVRVGDDSFDVQMFSMASPEDVALAMRVVTEVAALAGVGEADAELLGMLPIDAVVTHHDAAWADGQAASGVRVMRAMIADGRGPITIPGPRRSYVLGPRVLAELDAGGAETAHVRMLEAIRLVRWFPARTAAVFLTGNDTRFAAWVGDEVVFPAVPYAALALEREGDELDTPNIVGSLARSAGRPRETLIIDSTHVP